MPSEPAIFQEDRLSLTPTRLILTLGRRNLTILLRRITGVSVGPDVTSRRAAFVFSLVGLALVIAVIEGFLDFYFGATTSAYSTRIIAVGNNMLVFLIGISAFGFGIYGYKLHSRPSVRVSIQGSLLPLEVYRAESDADAKRVGDVICEAAENAR